MRVEHQGNNECMLATIAALENRPLDEIRRNALVGTSASCWEDITRHKVLFWTRIQAITSPNTYRAVARGNEGFVLVLSGAASDEPRVPERGQGAVTLWWRFGGHIMPYENGLIYDPDDLIPTGKTLQEILEKYKRIRGDYTRILITPKATGENETG